MKKIQLLFALIIFTCACKKEKLPETQDFNSPEFFVKCSVDGLPITIEAGKNNNYMYSTNWVNTDSLRVYCGELKQKNCVNSCGYSIKFEINDYKLSIYPQNIDSALQKGIYQINDSTLVPLYYRGTFFMSSSGTGTPNLNWTVNNTQPNQGNNVTYTFLKNSTPTVGLNKTISNCNQTHYNQFKIGNAFNLNISAYRDTSIIKRNFTFSAFPNISGNYTYLWEFGDGANSVLTNPTHAYATAGYYRVKLTLTNTSGVSEVCYYQIDATNPVICDANYFATFIGVPNKKAFSALNIKLIDNDGKVYSTKNLNQGNNAFAEIVSIENFKNNDNNQKTKKIKLRFSCTVYDGVSYINIENGEAVIAVAY